MEDTTTIHDLEISSKPKKKRRWLRWTATIIGVPIVLFLAWVMIGLRWADGPVGPFPGGELREGRLVTERDVDWSFAINGQIVELQFEDPKRSRTTGILLYDGDLYVPCDLGFGWKRFTGVFHTFGLIINIFKTWHEKAQLDGRAVVRIDGVRYERHAVRVDNPELERALRLQFNDLMQWYFQTDLKEAPDDRESIWFFRMEPRPLEKSVNAD